MVEIKNFDVMVVGAGFGGMYMLHKLRQQGSKYVSSRRAMELVGHGIGIAILEHVATLKAFNTHFNSTMTSNRNGIGQNVTT